MRRDQRLKAILFDLDGVLWFSVDAHRHAFEKTFKAMGFPWRFSKRSFSPYSGMTTEKALANVLKDRRVRWTGAQHEQFGRLKRKWAMLLLKTHAPLQAHIVDTLKRLSQSYRLAIVSSGQAQSIELFLKRSKTRRYFSAIIAHEDVRVSKPSPKVYRAGLRRLRLRPEEAVAVEDTISGTRSARGAGIPVIGMLGTCSAAVLRKAGAYHIVSRLTDLLSYVPLPQTGPVRYRRLHHQ